MSSPNFITINLGSAQEVKAVVIYDHNLTSTAIITIDADDAATFNSGGGGNPQLNGESITWNTEKITHYLTTATTKQYWRINITDTANTDGYIEIGELFIGSYFEPERTYERNVNAPTEYLMNQQENSYGVGRGRFYNPRQSFDVSFPYLLSADKTNFDTMLSTLNSKDTGISKPFFWNNNSDSPNNFWLVKMTNFPESWPSNIFYSFRLRMKEVVRSV